MKSFFKSMNAELGELRFYLTKGNVPKKSDIYSRSALEKLSQIEKLVQDQQRETAPDTTPAAPTEVPYTRGPMDQRERLDEPKSETYDDQEDKKLRIMCEGLRGHFEGVVKKALHVRELEKASEGGIISDGVVLKLLRSIEREDRLPEGNPVREWARKKIPHYE